MSTGYYTSDTPVSARVDAAWGKGYEKGLSDGRSLRYLFGGVILGAILERVHLGRLIRALGGWSLALLPWLVIAAALVAPVVLVALIVWTLALLGRGVWHKRGSGKRSTAVVAGTNGDPDF
jgi:hypothetical protein